MASSLAGELVDLRELSTGALDDILEEQTQAWRKFREWDFSQQAARVAFCLELGALQGHALVAGTKVAGYAQFLTSSCEGRIANLYVAREFWSAAAEVRLLDASVVSLQSMARRIVWHPALPCEIPAGALPLPASLKIYPRLFMLADVARAAASMEERRIAYGVEPWSDTCEELAARLVVLAHQGHVDREVNDQYSTEAGAREIIQKIVCLEEDGQFMPSASFVGIDRRSGALCGLLLVRQVLSEVAHGALLCVDPAARRTGLAYELVRRGMYALASLHFRAVSCTVAATNWDALGLFDASGFQFRFATDVCIWEGFKGG
jgi:ribosomal protein S18 acetylase RimI-like enzyme